MPTSHALPVAIGVAASPGQGQHLALRAMANDRHDASAAAELSALVDAVEACRSRLTALAERRNAAVRNSDDESDSLLVSIYEAERGLSTAIRLLQRAARTAR